MDEEQALYTRNQVRRIFQVPTGKVDEPRYLVTMYVGIGDAVTVGLSAVEQIIRNDHSASGSIDVLCNDVQAELFQYDPRINRIIEAQRILFPPPEVATWLKGVVMDEHTVRVVRFLRERRYGAVFPGIFAPAFFYRLHAPVMYPYLWKLGKDMLSLRSFADMPIGDVARQIVNRYFYDRLPAPLFDEATTLYVSEKNVRQALQSVDTIKSLVDIPLEESKLLVVAPDTASIVTRPPTPLLAEGLAAALHAMPNLIVYILPGYTNKQAASNLYQALGPAFRDRVFMRPPEPRTTLLDITTFIDQADIFVTGDTGLMHLASAIKCLRPDDDPHYTPRNRLKTVVLFGGTNPAFYGHSRRTVVLGRGRREQAAYRPGIAKESYNPRGKNFFDHIRPHELTEAIVYD